MPAGECYTTIQPTNIKHLNVITEAYPAEIERIWGDFSEVRPKRDNETWPDYFNDVIENMKDGLRLWRNDEGQDHVYNGTSGEGSFKNFLIMCRTINAIPLICMGHAEEKNSWLTRNPVKHLVFLENFCKYFAFYLRQEMGFIQAHLECWNEPQKCMSTDDYAKVCIAMATGFKQYKNFKVHIGSNDINVDVDFGWAKALVAKKELTNVVDYYSSHVLWPHQHKKGYMAALNRILLRTGLKQSITEFSPDGDWSNFDELTENGITIYCLLFAFRRDFFGDVFDDVKIFTREARPDISLKSGDWLPNGFNQDKYLKLIEFNRNHYRKQLEVEDEDMQLEEYYYKNKVTYNRDPKKAGIKFIQSVVGISPNGIWDNATETAVEKYQVDYGLKIDGIVGPDTFRNMMKYFPDAYIDLQYFTQTGKW